MYILEGNIGAGKSTFLNKIKDNLLELKVITEPVNSWTNEVFGQSLLENFYKNTSRWAYTLENLAMIHRVKDHIEIQKNKKKIIVMERSIYSGHYCFAQNSYKNGFLNQTEWKIYQEWTNFLLKNCNKPKGFIYLKANPKICMERIKKRNRASEKTISLDYIEQIDKWHETFLIKKEGIYKDLKTVPVLKINCDISFEDDEQITQKHIKTVKNFIEKTNNI